MTTATGNSKMGSALSGAVARFCVPALSSLLASAALAQQIHVSGPKLLPVGEPQLVTPVAQAAPVIAASPINTLLLNLPAEQSLAPVVANRVASRIQVFRTTYNFPIAEKPAESDRLAIGSSWSAIVFHLGKLPAVDSPLIFESELQRWIARLKPIAPRLIYVDLSLVDPIPGAKVENTEAVQAALGARRAIAARVALSAGVEYLDLDALIQRNAAIWLQPQNARLTGAGVEGVAGALAAVLSAKAPPAPTQRVYYLFVFSFQPDFIAPPDYRSHSFATFVEATPQNKILGVKTISWLPAVGLANPLAVLPVKGRNFPLKETLDMAVEFRTQISQMGPYEIKAELYERAAARVKELDSGRLRYIVLDKLWRNQESGALMCVHAISDVGGPLTTRYKRGYTASRTLVEHFRPFLLRTLPAGGWLEWDLGLKNYQIMDRTER